MDFPGSRIGRVSLATLFVFTVTSVTALGLQVFDPREPPGPPLGWALPGGIIAALCTLWVALWLVEKHRYRPLELLMALILAEGLMALLVWALLQGFAAPLGSVFPESFARMGFTLMVPCLVGALIALATPGSRF